MKIMRQNGWSRVVTVLWVLFWVLFGAAFQADAAGVVSVSKKVVEQGDASAPALEEPLDNSDDGDVVPHGDTQAFAFYGKKAE